MVGQQTAGTVNGSRKPRSDGLVDRKGCGVAVMRRACRGRVGGVSGVAVVSLCGITISMRHLFCLVWIHDTLDKQTVVGIVSQTARGDKNGA